jgi:hypothetical protein
MSGQPQRKWSLSDISAKGNRLPNRYVLHGVEGWGKSSWGAQFPKPIFLQSRGETGLETLIDSGQLPEVPHFPEMQNWLEVRNAIQVLTEQEQPYKTFVIDTLNGVERLCHEYVCAKDFDGNWGDKGFGSYNKGYEVSLSEWRMFLQDLDNLRQRRGMIIILLCHTKVRPFKNPEGSDFDRYQPDVHEKTWGLTHKWADVVLFGNFLIATSEDRQSKRAKGIGGKMRMLYCERSAAWDAKNRIGLPEAIEMTGETPAAAFAVFKAAVEAGRINAPGGDQ